MTAPVPAPRRWSPAWHLVWALPLATVGASILVWAAAFLWCGVWGCYQGRNGSAVGVLLLCLSAGALVGVTFVLVSWSPRRGVRAAVGAVVGAVVAAAAALYVLGI